MNANEEIKKIYTIIASIERRFFDKMGVTYCDIVCEFDKRIDEVHARIDKILTKQYIPEQISSQEPSPDEPN